MVAEGENLRKLLQLVPSMPFVRTNRNGTGIVISCTCAPEHMF